VTARMKEFLPNDDLVFLMRLSIEPMRQRLGLATVPQNEMRSSSAFSRSNDDRGGRE